MDYKMGGGRNGTRVAVGGSMRSIGVALPWQTSHWRNAGRHGRSPLAQWMTAAFVHGLEIKG